MNLRNAHPDDFDAVQSLYHQLLVYEHDELGYNVNPDFAHSDYGIECLRGFVADNVGTMAVVYEDINNGVIGYASLRDVPPLEVAHRANMKQCEIETICVHHLHRGQGIGRALISECQKIAKINGYTHLKIVALVKNVPARYLYRDCGFDEQEIIHEMVL